MKKLSGYNFLIILIVSFLGLLSFDFITQKNAFEEKSKRYNQKLKKKIREPVRRQAIRRQIIKRESIRRQTNRRD